MPPDLQTPDPARKKLPRKRAPRNPDAVPSDSPEATPGSRVSMREVARLAKVSVATVSMVLNDNPRISRATHLRVQRLMDRMGYQPYRLAQSRSGRYTQVLAVLLPA